MEGGCSISALVLSVVLVVSVLGASFAGDVQHETTEYITGDPSSSGDDEGVVIVRSQEVNFGKPEEENKEHAISEAEAETATTPPPKATVAAKEDGQAAEAARSDAVISPSAKVIIWDESVDLATTDSNQDQASAAGGTRERKEHPPSQERHSDVEASKKKDEEAGAGEESQIVSEGRSHVNLASSSSSLLSSSSIWKTALFAVFGSTVLLLLMKIDLDSTSKQQQSYNHCSNSQSSKRSQEMRGSKQLTCQYTHHSSAQV